MDLYDRAMTVGVRARNLLDDIHALDRQAEPEAGGHFHAGLVGDVVRRAIVSSRLEPALQEFEKAMYSALPDIRGEHDLERYIGGLRTGYARFHGNLDDDFYADLKETARAAGFEWREFEVGIGAAGVEIIVGFGTSLAAAVVYDFLKALCRKELDPTIDSQTAVELCKVDLLHRRKAGPVGAAYSLQSPVAHAKYEVYLHEASGETVHVFLVRANGDVVGRKERRMAQRPPPARARP